MFRIELLLILLKLLRSDSPSFPNTIFKFPGQVRRRPAGLTYFRQMRWRLTFQQAAVAKRQYRTDRRLL